MNTVLSLPNLSELCERVKEILCKKDNLDPELTAFHHSVLMKREKPCGMFFQVHGPRLLKNYAVWAGEECRVIFYDCNGERFAELQLSESPDPSKLAA